VSLQGHNAVASQINSYHVGLLFPSSGQLFSYLVWRT